MIHKTLQQGSIISITSYRNGKCITRNALVISATSYNKAENNFIAVPIIEDNEVLKTTPWSTMLDERTKTKGGILSNLMKPFDIYDNDADFLEMVPTDILDDVLNKNPLIRSV